MSYVGIYMYNNFKYVFTQRNICGNSRSYQKYNTTYVNKNVPLIS